jgi:hypothetical protein
VKSWHPPLPTTSRYDRPPCTHPQFTEQITCFAALLQSLTHREGSKKAIQTLRVLSIQDSFVRRNCHRLAHQIGEAAIDRYKDLGVVFAQGDPFCDSGYYHGAIEYSAKGQKEFHIRQYCQTFAPTDHPTDLHNHCIHGTGHAAMIFTNLDLSAALHLCDTYPQVWERDSCYNGAFMEQVIVEMERRQKNEPVEQVPTYTDTSAPLDCTQYNFHQKRQCYLSVLFFTLHVSGFDTDAVINTCEKIEPDFKNKCFQDVGRLIAIRSNLQTNSIITRCLKTKAFTAQENCFIGVVKFILLNHDTTGNMALKFCHDIPNMYTNTCRNFVQTFDGKPF